MIKLKVLKLISRASCAGGWKFEFQSPAKSPTHHCKRFATTSTSTQVAVLPWRYYAEMGTANSLHTSAQYDE